MKIEIYSIISFFALFAYFLPIAVLILLKKTHQRTLLLFGIYWSVTGIFNIMGKLPFIEAGRLESITVIYNMLDIPAVLWILSCTTVLPKIRKFSAVMAPTLLVIQILNFSIQGWHYHSALYTLPLGLLTVLVVLFWEVYHYMDQIEHTPQQNAMIFMHCSLLFAYGSFVLVYIFDYCIRIGTATDTYLIYYISTLIALGITMMGITLRIKEQPAYARLKREARGYHDSSDRSLS